MTVSELIREAAARRAAIFAYAQMHDRFANVEQELAGAGNPTLAADAHEYALIALRAYRAELDDPPSARDAAEQADHENREGQWR